MDLSVRQDRQDGMDDSEDLDEYLSQRLEESNSDQELDVYTQLANKEKDLLLAAELGKALLEKNDELEQMNDKLHEEYQQKLEQLEQEKHECRLRSENTERQYETLIKELQADLSSYKKQVESKESSMKLEERERYQIVTELTKQNERLTEQIRKTEECVEELSNDNHVLRQQILSRQSSTQAQAQQQQLLRDEVTLLSEKQTETEKRIQQLVEERDALAVSLEESQERILMMEKQKLDKDSEIRSRNQQIEELKDSNVLLEERLEDVYLQVSSGEFSQNNSLLSELEMSTENLDHLCRSTENIRSLRNHTLSPHVSLHELDDIECDDDDVDVAMVTCTGSFHDYDGALDSSSNLDVRHEYIESYKLVRSLCRKLKQNSNTNNTPNLPSPSDDHQELDTGSLLNLLQDLRECIEELHHKACSQYDELYVKDLEQRINELTLELGTTRRQLENLRNQMHGKDEEITRTSKQLDETNRRLTLQHQEMVRIHKERDDYNDQIAKPPAQKMVDQARKDRDAAIARKNSMELELAKVKLDLASTERQLMDAVHQKIRLSEQLEQCQMDFESVLDFQMQKRFNTELTMSPKRRQREQSPKKLFSFRS